MYLSWDKNVFASILFIILKIVIFHPYYFQILIFFNIYKNKKADKNNQNRNIDKFIKIDNVYD